jgi:hypothetical protein
MYLRMRIAEVIVATLTEIGQSTMPLQQLTALVKGNEPLWANKSDLEIRQNLDSMFITEFRIRDVTLQIKRGDDKKPLLVMS